mmetsp:Transcript_20312/g.64636  ORF Transcript_20312/g.64636 Transcript_20312/m.64636 type:complete len:361 (+) Transcript_20312:106-1188(+)
MRSGFDRSRIGPIIRLVLIGYTESQPEIWWGRRGHPWLHLALKRVLRLTSPHQCAAASRALMSSRRFFCPPAPSRAHPAVPLTAPRFWRMYRAAYASRRGAWSLSATKQSSTALSTSTASCSALSHSCASIPSAVMTTDCPPPAAASSAESTTCPQSSGSHTVRAPSPQACPYVLYPKPYTRPLETTRVCAWPQATLSTPCGRRSAGTRCTELGPSPPPSDSDLKRMPREGGGLPSPSLPSPRQPQSQRAPPSPTAAEWCAPAATLEHFLPSRAATLRGRISPTPVRCPSCPARPSPQEYTSPDSVRAIVWSWPQATEATSRSTASASESPPSSAPKSGIVRGLDCPSLVWPCPSWPFSL